MMVLKEPKGNKVSKVRLVFRGLMVFKVKPVFKAPLVRKVFKVKPELKELMVSKVSKVL